MRLNELRIGNFVYHKAVWSYRQKQEPFIEFQFAWNESDWFAIGDCTLLEENFEPIPLTEEWLFKFGFNTQIDTRFDKGYIWAIETIIEFIYLLRKSKIDNHYNLFRLDNFTQREYPIKYVIKYVHELQNLYFALTEKELEAKL